MDYRVVEELLKKINLRCLRVGIKYEVYSNSGIYRLVKYMCKTDEFGRNVHDWVELCTTQMLSEVAKYLTYALDYMSTFSFMFDDKILEVLMSEGMKGLSSDSDYHVYLGTKELGYYRANSFCIACVKALDDAKNKFDGDETPVDERKLKLVLPELTYNGLKFSDRLS